MLSHDFIVDALKNAAFTGRKQTTLYSGVSIDSRKIKEGMLFVALKGDRFDGHDFIHQAIDAGAHGVIYQADRCVEIPSTIGSYRVTDSLSALRKMAASHRLRLNCPVVAVAGSVGKTTTKELLAAMLRGKFAAVVSTENSENGHIGVPLTILKASDSCGALVVEIGIDRPGSMLSHLELVRPTVGIVTAITPEHLEGLGDMETVAKEECLCLRWVANHGGQIALNLDDERTAAIESELRGMSKFVWSYQLTTPAGKSHPGFHGTLRHCDISHRNKLLIAGNNGNSSELDVPLPGVHNARNLLGAVVIAQALSLNAEQMRNGLKTFSSSEGRSVIAKSKNGAVVLCDYYNASPASMAAAFQTLYDLKGRTDGRLVAILGDMLELGEQEEKLHRGLADELTRLNFDIVFCYGPRMKWLEDALRRNGFTGRAEASNDLNLLIDRLRKMLRAEDVLLIKGSRGMRMEQVWSAIDS